MNLLNVFLKNLAEPYRVKLKVLAPRGTTGLVWQLMQEELAHDEFDKDRILKSAGISTSHLDKITSELLGKCYQLLFEGDNVALLNFLSNNSTYVKLFYNELSRQTKVVLAGNDPEEKAKFLRRCFDMIQTNMPIVFRDSKASEKLALQYTSLFKGVKKKEAEFYTANKLLLERMEVLFAAAEIKNKAPDVEKELQAIGVPSPGFDGNVVFEHYWTRIYFYHAIEEFSKALEIATKALVPLKKFTGGKYDINLMRIELKTNEFLYYLSPFDDAYNNYHRIITAPGFEKIPDRAYHANKYMQLGLITSNYTAVGNMLEPKLKSMGERMEHMITPRDIITAAKYYLFTGNYAEAFRFIQLGFEKNPKGKYFQYELEFRNLQTAYFFFIGQHDVVMDMCAKHIKFLRNHNYTIRSSGYPHFYILTKAILFKHTGMAFSKKHNEMLERYQRGSYAVYGKLLMKMLNA